MLSQDHAGNGWVENHHDDHDDDSEDSEEEVLVVNSDQKQFVNVSMSQCLESWIFLSELLSVFPPQLQSVDALTLTTNH